jgi:hypothetical protein
MNGSFANRFLLFSLPFFVAAFTESTSTDAPASVGHKNGGDRDATAKPCAPITPSPGELDFGRLEQNQKKELAFWLSNETATLARVATVETSCDCVKTQLEATDIPPFAKVRGRACFDLGADRDFTGTLRMQVNGISPSGELVFNLAVKVNVIDPAKGSKGNEQRISSTAR